MSIKELEAPTWNVPALAYEINKDIFIEGHNGENLDLVEQVPGFSFHDSRWAEELDEELANISTPISSLSFAAPETVCGRDDRVKIPNTTIAPFKFICKLYITAANGKKYIGSGFFISPRCVITSGHVVHSSEGWAKSIQIIPGLDGRTMPFGSATSSEFYSVAGWTSKQKTDYDHGAIILPDDTLYNRIRGYMGYRQANGLPILNNSGYPGDKNPSVNQWFNAGRATENTGFKFKYMLDTAGGQSGSPTYIKAGASSIAVGVHGYGGCPNASIRVQGYVIQRWTEWRTR